MTKKTFIFWVFYVVFIISRTIICKIYQSGFRGYYLNKRNYLDQVLLPCTIVYEGSIKRRNEFDENFFVLWKILVQSQQ